MAGKVWAASVLAGGWLALLGATPAAWGQANFGPIQPFAGAPTPVYVAGPYAGPTLFAPVGVPAAIGAAPQVQIPAAPFTPPVISAPPVAPSLPLGPAPGCCGASAGYGAGYAPNVAYRPYVQSAAPGPRASNAWGGGYYYPPNAYASGQPMANYLPYYGQ